MHVRFDVDGFFKPSAFNAERHPPAAPGALAQAQRRLGVVLPVPFPALYALHDGGHTAKQYCEGFADVWLPDGYLYRLEELTSFESEHALADWEWRQEVFFDTFDQAQREKLVIFAKHAFAQYLCLDYRDSAERPAVLWIDLDAHPAPTITPLAPSAADFFALLREEEPES